MGVSRFRIECRPAALFTWCRVVLTWLSISMAYCRLHIRNKKNGHITDRYRTNVCPIGGLLEAIMVQLEIEKGYGRESDPSDRRVSTGSRRDNMAAPEGEREVRKRRERRDSGCAHERKERRPHSEERAPPPPPPLHDHNRLESERRAERLSRARRPQFGGKRRRQPRTRNDIYRSKENECLLPTDAIYTDYTEEFRTKEDENYAEFRTKEDDYSEFRSKEDECLLRVEDRNVSPERDEQDAIECLPEPDYDRFSLYSASPSGLDLGALHRQLDREEPARSHAAERPRPAPAPAPAPRARDHHERQGDRISKKAHSKGYQQRWTLYTLRHASLHPASDQVCISLHRQLDREEPARSHAAERPRPAPAPAPAPRARDHHERQGDRISKKLDREEPARSHAAERPRPAPAPAPAPRARDHHERQGDRISKKLDREEPARSHAAERPRPAPAPAPAPRARDHHERQGDRISKKVSEWN
ncbi:unnamed protein product [Plutella xylostella]|uniref:(diamondback moth) hypothetical protein n=1 Tax=Plutella xylostella TaxID=51655 RepID=A0A8S4FXB9_PLUXY|nr:unnamed protein product [Plutella xylostella]